MALRAADPDAPRIPRKDRTGASPFKVGAIVLASSCVGDVLRLHQARPVHARLPRQGRLPVGQLDPRRTRRCASPASTSARSRRSSARTAPNAAVVTMEIDDKGLPIHKDATLKIRPRIFLEGNFFVDMQPGTPGTPTLGDGDTMPIAQTSDPGAARPGADRAAAGHASAAAGAARQDYGEGADDKPTAAAGRRPGPERRAG